MSSSELLSLLKELESGSISEGEVVRYLEKELQGYRRLWRSIEWYLVILYRMVFELQKLEVAKKLFKYLERVSIKEALDKDTVIACELIRLSTGTKLDIYNKDEVMKELSKQKTNNPILQLIILVVLTDLSEKYDPALGKALNSVKRFLEERAKLLKEVMEEDPEIVKHYFIDLDLKSNYPTLSPLHDYFIKRGENLWSEYLSRRSILEELENEIKELNEKLQHHEIILSEKGERYAKKLLGILLIILSIGIAYYFIIIFHFYSLLILSPITLIIYVLEVFNKLELLKRAIQQYLSKLLAKGFTWLLRKFDDECKSLIEQMKRKEVAKIEIEHIVSKKASRS
ncbi:MAG: hypothetical protein QXZ60_04715 [Sulfolobales archaeon]